MRGERSAAELSVGNDDLAAVGGQHANGGFVQGGEAHLRDASGEEGHARAARALRGKRLAETREEEFVLDWRHQAFAIGQAEQPQAAPIRAPAIAARSADRNARGAPTAAIRRG